MELVYLIVGVVGVLMIGFSIETIMSAWERVQMKKLEKENDDVK